MSLFPTLYRSAGAGSYDYQPPLGDGGTTALLTEMIDPTAGVCGNAFLPTAGTSIGGFINYLDDILPAKVVNSTTGL